ncbi:MAG: dockerin type I repeat-containing protein, partial [Ruminococcus callidus]|nr:dockerin type I repeat-containing protein [Ruminococcus callidus]
TTTTTTTSTTTVTTTTTTSSAQTEPTALYGDLNLDGRVDITDAVLLNKACAGAVMLDDAAKKNADCNGDSEVGSDDAVVLMQFLVRIVNKLPYQN